MALNSGKKGADLSCREESQDDRVVMDEDSFERLYSPCKPVNNSI